MTSTTHWFWAGAFLLGISGYPLILMAREVVVGWSVDSRYRFYRLDMADAAVGVHRVSLVDDVPPSMNSVERIRGRVRVVIDGQVRTVADNVEIRSSITNPDRYFGHIALVRVLDLRQQQESIAIIVNRGVDPNVPRLSNGRFDFERLRFQIIAVDSKGAVTDETFLRSERDSPPTRAALARFVSPSPMGYHSDLMMVWPTFLYPVVFPWGAGAVGVMCLTVAYSRRTRSVRGA